MKQFIITDLENVKIYKSTVIHMAKNSPTYRENSRFPDMLIHHGPLISMLEDKS